VFSRLDEKCSYTRGGSCGGDAKWMPAYHRRATRAAYAASDGNCMLKPIHANNTAGSTFAPAISRMCHSRSAKSFAICNSCWEAAW
jgi:hypothetical protein